MTLKNMLLAIVATLVLAMAGEGFFAIVKLRDINANVTNEATNWVPSIYYSQSIGRDLSDLRVDEGKHILSTSDNDMKAVEAEMTSVLAQLNADRRQYEPLISSDAERAQYDRFRTGLGQYTRLHERMLTLSRANSNTEAANLFKGDMQTVYQPMSDAIAADADINRKGAEADYRTAEAAFRLAFGLVLLGLGLAIAVGIAAAVFIRNKIARPINALADAMNRVARGETTQIEGLHRHDEVGEMARAFEANAVRIATIMNEAATEKERGEIRRKESLLALADTFERSVGTVVTQVSSAATEMQAAATQLTAAAHETSVQSATVSAAAEEAGSNVTSVASSAEELGASVQEIGRQVEVSASISATAVREADSAVAVVAELDQVAGSISGIVDMIAGLASQTNLLALNATIESARAGEAGKGFAVVAAEVKGLAGQTAKATTEISAKIAQIQDASARAAGVIRAVTDTIQNINHANTTIASAVEQQSAATQEIVQAVGQASVGTQEVTGNISGVALAAEQTGAAATQVLAASSELAEQAANLNCEMDRFLSTVRSAA